MGQTIWFPGIPSYLDLPSASTPFPDHLDHLKRLKHRGAPRPSAIQDGLQWVLGHLVPCFSHGLGPFAYRPGPSAGNPDFQVAQ